MSKIDSALDCYLACAVRSDSDTAARVIDSPGNQVTNSTNLVVCPAQLTALAYNAERSVKEDNRQYAQPRVLCVHR
jgi:hypothetical protein